MKARKLFALVLTTILLLWWSLYFRDGGFEMPRGLPDDSNVVKEGPVYALHDMAELAARLGSPVNFIRYGDVIMLDDFEGGVAGWDRTIYSTDGYIRLSSTRRRSGGCSAHLSGGKVVSTSVKLSRELPVPESSKVGWGFGFQIEDGADRLIFGIIQTQGERNYHFTIKYDHNLEKLYYWDNTPEYVEFADLKLKSGSHLFHLCKLVVNFHTHKYDKLYIDDQVWDLSSYVPEDSSGAGEADSFVVMIQATGDGLVSTHVYIDDAVVTQNEF